MLRRLVAPVVGLCAVVLTAGMLPTVSATAAPQAAPDQVQAPVPTLDWGTCEEDWYSSPDQCATAAVPLDYDDPTGATVDLDLLKVPASDPAHRIGTLFVNPGGPGGSSRDFAAFFQHLVPKEVHQKFDIVGIDPRGIGPSAPATCRSSTPPPAMPMVAFPVSKHQARAQIRVDRWARQACREHGSRILDHMSTADTARDMDLVRQAVGDDELTYYGVSYGTQLGSTYAAMFPDRVRAMILDGVLDPVAWTTGVGHQSATQGFSERLGSGHGAWVALNAAFAECDRVGHDRCPIAGHATATWLDLVRYLRRHPSKDAHYQDLVGLGLGMLYDGRGVHFLMRFLNRLHRVLVEHHGAGLGRELSRAVDARRAQEQDSHRGLPGPYGLGGLSGWGPRLDATFQGVACADSENPASEQTWIKAGRRSEREAPWFGRLWTWAGSACAGWPASTQADRFTGPFAVTTANPVLVVGNTYDPATPISGARAVNRLLGGSHLLVMDGWGHGAIHSGPCVDGAYAAYLVGQVLPDSGTVCQPGRELFPRRR